MNEGPVSNRTCGFFHLLVPILAVLLVAGHVHAAGIRVIPSVDRVIPGEDFHVDIVAENIPLNGLGAVQFRLHVEAVGAAVAGIFDLSQAGPDTVAISAPLLTSASTSTRSGLGEFFLGNQGPEGILVLDNESFHNGSALFTYAHTHGASRPSGTGSIARVLLRVGKEVGAEQIGLHLSEVMLLNGEIAHPLEYNIGASVTLRCSAVVPDLTGLTSAEAKSALLAAGLMEGDYYKIANHAGTLPLGVVLEQSEQAGSTLECDSAVHLAVNFAPQEVSAGEAVDKPDNETGTVILSWNPSTSTDAAGYRIYLGTSRLLDLPDPAAAMAEISGLENGVVQNLRVTVYDTYGNESAGLIIPATALDDVPPRVEIAGIEDGAFYAVTVMPEIQVNDNHLSGTIITLNGKPWVPSPLTGDDSYTLAVTAFDAAGNETSRMVAFTIDTTPPVVTIGHPAEGSWYNTSIIPQIIITDLHLGDDSTSLTLNEQPYLAGTPVSTEGAYSLVVTARDLAGNVGFSAVEFFLDKTAPSTTAVLGDPRFESGGEVYIAGTTPVTLQALDDGPAASGVARIEHRFPGDQQWSVYEEPVVFSGLPEGDHALFFRAVDQAGNMEEDRSLSAIVDITPPETSVSLNNHGFMGDDRLFVFRDTEVALTAVDQLSGVRDSHYRFGDDPGWHTYHGAFSLGGLSYGDHLLHYRSVDNVKNVEAEKSLAISLVGVDAQFRFLDLPRVLIWTADPYEMRGNNRLAYSLNDISGFLTQAFGSRELYFTLVTDTQDFQGLFRSGIYNMIMVISQEVPFNSVFLREMKEAVHRGMGLLVSSWGKSVPPLWQDVFGLDFKGSLPMSEDERTLHLLAGPLSDNQVLAVKGRLLKTELAGGTLAGVIPGESVCQGIRAVTLFQPVEIEPGDRIIGTLQTRQGKKSVPVDEEQFSVSSLPSGLVNNFSGQIFGDLALEATAAGVSIFISAPYGYLEEDVFLSLTIEQPAAGTVSIGPVLISPDCKADLRVGMLLDSMRVEALNEDRARSSDDIPAVVLNVYGKGKTAFFSYDLIESALAGGHAAHAGLLEKGAGYLLPPPAGPAPAGVVLLETSITGQGAGGKYRAEEVLGRGLTHLPLFDLTQTPLEYELFLEQGESESFRYFVRIDDRIGTYKKETNILFYFNSLFLPIDRLQFEFKVNQDLISLLQEAAAWVEDASIRHPEEAEVLAGINQDVQAIANSATSQAADNGKLIHRLTQTVHQAGNLSFEWTELREILGECLRILGSREYFGS